MEVIIYQVDAFSEKPFEGNPAGVVPDAKGLDELDMQSIANEMNLSETAFIVKKDSTSYEVRFFTPICEVELCGHATIAAFYVLAQKGYITNIDNGTITVKQITKAGELPVEIQFKNGNVTKVLMHQGEPNSLGVLTDTDELANILGIEKEDIGLSNVVVYPEIISTGLPDIMIPVKSKRILDNLNVKFNKLEEYSKKHNVTGAHVFCLDECHSKEVFCRNFAPAVGIDEEAATGTANGALSFYLEKNKLLFDGEMIAKQGESLNRPSYIHCQVVRNEKSYQIKVGGKANVVIQGVISI